MKWKDVIYVVALTPSALLIHLVGLMIGMNSLTMLLFQFIGLIVQAVAGIVHIKNLKKRLLNNGNNN